MRDTAWGTAASRFVAWAWVRSAASLVLLVAGCGGGGGDSSAPDNHALPALSSDTYPTGPRVDVSAQDFLPFHENDRSVYTRTTGGLSDGTVTRTVLYGPDQNGNFSITESDGTNSSFTNDQLSAAGLREYDPLGAQTAAPAIYAAFPSDYAYETPFYAAGGTVSHVRQGDLQGDTDGDGKSDSFRVEQTQVFVGFETMPVLGRSMQVAHFTTILRLTIVGSKDGKSSTVSATEDSYLASGLGLVRADRSAVGADGTPLLTPYRLDLQSATINGVAHLDLTSSVEVALDHQFLVYDPTRAVYYAAVTSTDPAHGNRIATIAASTAAITYSAPIGSSPNALAVSADGSALYVGLDGSGEVVRLALPAMTEVSRLRLPVDPFFGQLFAEQIAVVPGTNDAYAVSMDRQNTSPRYQALGLVRANVLQPRLSQDVFSNNSIAFDPANAGFFYGYNDESTEFGLRQFQVVGDGVSLQATTSAGGGFGAELRVADGLAVVGNKVFRADASLALLGTVSGASQCVKLPSIAKIVCHSTNDANQLAIVDAATFAPLASIAYTGSSSAPHAAWRLVPGPSGQVAVSETGRITLFTNAAVQ